MKAVATDIKVAQKDMPKGIPFKVSSNGKMMNMLSDTLYSDKIRAVVRELSTNALDAHRFAGVEDKPFSLTLPTYDNQEFRIRDYGTGLSKEDMEKKVYPIYGVSTRDQSNQFTGALGLGSKSPLAYVDSFTVSSYYDGMKYTYICSKDRRGIPVLFCVSEKETTEGNGLEVTFVTKKNDYTAFQRAANNVYRYFPTLPTCNTTIVVDKPDVILENPGWTLYKDNDSAYAVMGNVRYPIDSSQIQQGSDKNQPISWYQYNTTTQEQDCKSTKVNASQMLDLSFELRFEIGEIDFDLGREKLQYNQHTKDNILEKLAQISLDLKGKIEQKIASSKNFWEAQKNFNSLKKKFGYTWHNTIAKVEWQGRDVTIPPTTTGLGTYVKQFYIRSYCSSVSNRMVGEIDSEKETIFLLDDIKQGAIKTATELVRRDGGQVYLIADTMDLQKFCDAVGIDITYIELASKLYPQFKSTTVRGQTTQVPCCKFVPSTSYYTMRKNFWEDFVVDLEDGGYYVELRNFEAKLSSSSTVQSTIDNQDFTKVLTDAVSLGIFKTAPTVVGIKTRWIKKYKESKKWINLFDYIIEQLSTMALVRKVSAEDAEYFSNTLSYNNVYTYDYKVDCPVWKQYHDVIKSIEADKDSYKKYRRMAKNLRTKDYIDTTKIKDVLQNYHSQFIQKYLLLPLLQRNLRESQLKSVSEYVHQVAQEAQIRYV